MDHNKEEILKIINTIKKQGKDNYSIAMGAIMLMDECADAEIEPEQAVELAIRINRVKGLCKAQLIYEEVICTVCKMINRVDVEFVHSMSDEELVSQINECGIADLETVVDNYYGA